MLIAPAWLVFVLDVVFCEFDDYSGYDDSSYSYYDEELSPDATNGRVRRFEDQHSGPPSHVDVGYAEEAVNHLLSGRYNNGSTKVTPSRTTLEKSPIQHLYLFEDEPPNIQPLYPELSNRLEDDNYKFNLAYATVSDIKKLTPFRTNKSLSASETSPFRLPWEPTALIPNRSTIFTPTKTATRKPKEPTTHTPAKFKIYTPKKSVTRTAMVTATHKSTTRTPFTTHTPETTTQTSTESTTTPIEDEFHTPKLSIHTPTKFTMHTPRKFTTHQRVRLTSHPPSRSTPRVPIRLKSRTPTRRIHGSVTTRARPLGAVTTRAKLHGAVPTRATLHGAVTTRAIIHGAVTKTHALASVNSRALAVLPLRVQTTTDKPTTQVSIPIRATSRRPTRVFAKDVLDDLNLDPEKNIIMRTNDSDGSEVSAAINIEEDSTDIKNSTMGRPINPTNATKTTTSTKTITSTIPTCVTVETTKKTTTVSTIPPMPLYWRTYTPPTPPTTTAGPRFDIEKFLEIITNLTIDYDTNLTQQVNETLQKYNIPMCATPNLTTTTTEVTTTTEAEYRPTGLNRTIISKCFVCGLEAKGIPFNAECADAFSGDFLPLTPQEPLARGKMARFRKYCRYGDVTNYVKNVTTPRTVYGRWTGGCAVRWTDISGIYTQRTCRNRKRATTGKHYASKRMAKLEMALAHTEEGCIVSPVATLLPLSRGISLFARFHACVCTANWCNAAAALPASPLSLATALAAVCACL